MRKLLLLSIALCFGLYTIGQQRAIVSKELRNKAVVKTSAVKGIANPTGEVAPQKGDAIVKTADDIGNTWYDVQSNRGVQDRIYLYDDGTIGGVWTRGPEGSPSGADRGTGYNYFNGSDWGDYPTTAIESGATAGWPSYGAYGENGEVYTCHDYYEGTILGIRDVRGTGDWNLVIQAGPTGLADISFPRVVTSGENNDMVHILSTTWSAYNGQDHALLYARTGDAGLTWEVENQLFEELGPDFSLDIGGDIYEWAEPKDGLLAFTTGDNWMDFVLMKSDDDGESWDLTTIWECPFPLSSGVAVDTFYCPDGSQDLAIDMNGKVHVTFSLTRAISDDAGAQSYYPGVDGVVYWNEDMESFSGDIDALSPYGDENSELIENYNLIGWSQDLDGNGTIDIIDVGGTYNTGLSSQPQITIDDMNQIFIVYSSVTEGFDNDLSNFRHLWARASMNGGEWWGDFIDLNEDIIYSFDECVFPSLSSTSDDNIHLTYQADNEPGYLTNNPAENTIRYRSVPKDGLLIGVNEEKVISETNVSQNFPNPFNGTSSIFVTLDKQASLGLTVTNMVGQVVYQLPAKKYNTGRQELIIDASGFPTGIYFYTVNSGDKSVTKKMIVE